MADISEDSKTKPPSEAKPEIEQGPPQSAEMPLSTAEMSLSTAEMPLLTERAKRMLQSISGTKPCHEDLMDEIYRMVVEDADTVADRAGNPEFPAVAEMCRKCIRDQKETLELPELLRSLDWKAIRAMIDNTIAYEYVNDPTFKDQFTKMDICAGVYLNSFVVKSTGKGLSANQWEELQQMMQRYADGIDCIPSNAYEEESAREAAEIHRAGDSSVKKLEVYLDAARNGDREFLQKTGGLLFIQRISRRCTRASGPEGDIPQLQMPIQIGCSKAVSRRSAAYDPNVGLTSVPNTWKLTLSCLAVMKIEVETVSIPILKIWKHPHLFLAEILATLLTGSLIGWGGFNPIAPGTAVLASNIDLARGERQVFVESTRASDNLAASSAIFSERLELLKDAQAVGEEIRKLEQAQAKIQELKERSEKANSRARTLIDQLSTATDEMASNNTKLEAAITKKEEYKAFRDNVDSWLAKIKKR